MTDNFKILLVDDEPDVLDYLTAVFEDDGYEVISATNGKEAFELARKVKPSLISLDITMPDQTGTRTFINLKKDPDLRNIPVIVITATVDSESGFSNLLDGFQRPEGFVIKPVNPKELLGIVRTILGAKQDTLGSE